MVLVDTCGWIEWFTDSPLAESYAPYLEQPDTLLVPTLVQHELYKWLSREKDIGTALSAIVATRSANVLPLDASLALVAADLGREFKLATADAIIYATARQHGAKLITSDAHFTQQRKCPPWNLEQSKMSACANSGQEKRPTLDQAHCCGALLPSPRALSGSGV